MELNCRDWNGIWNFLVGAHAWGPCWTPREHCHRTNLYRTVPYTLAPPSCIFIQQVHVCASLVSSGIETVKNWIFVFLTCPTVLCEPSFIAQWVCGSWSSYYVHVQTFYTWCYWMASRVCTTEKLLTCFVTDVGLGASGLINVTSLLLKTSLKLWLESNVIVMAWKCVWCRCDREAVILIFWVEIFCITIFPNLLLIAESVQTVIGLSEYCHERLWERCRCMANATDFTASAPWSELHESLRAFFSKDNCVQTRNTCAKRFLLDNALLVFFKPCYNV